MPKIPRREFLQLAGTYDPEKHNIGGWYISEKLDGTRCFWDGGISRGMKTTEVPYAGLLDPKTGKIKSKIKETATGLWSRYGNPISAPDWFLDLLPSCLLDGELWAGRGNFQINRSIVSHHEPDEEQWKKIKYALYGTPSWWDFAKFGQIKNNNMLRLIDLPEMLTWFSDNCHKEDGDVLCTVTGSTFEQELGYLGVCEKYKLDDTFFVLEQKRLPKDEEKAKAAAKKYFEKLVKKGAEGCVIRDPNAIWTPKRHNGLLKYKPVEDAEATVVGFVAGEKGRKGERLGRIGGLLLKCTEALNNVEFELGVGLNREEQELATEKAKQWAIANPGKEMPKGTRGKHFKVGDLITFQYRDLTDKGIPKEARYFRHRDAE